MAKKYAKRIDKRSKRRNRKTAFKRVMSVRRQFPTVVYHNEETVPKLFLSHIKDAFESVFRNPDSLGNMQWYYQHVLKVGGRQAWCEFMTAAKQAGHDPEKVALHLVFDLGSEALSLIPKEVRKSYIGKCNVSVQSEVRTSDKRVHVYLSGLDHAKSQYGTIYYSQHRPTVRVDGKSLIVGYMRHTLERVAERAVAYPLTYAGWGDVYGIIAQQDEARLGQWEKGVVLWEKCEPGFMTTMYARQILGATDDDVKEHTHLYRAGYCICKENGGFYAATSFLCPGMKGTPEADAYLAKGGKRSVLWDGASLLSYGDIADHQDLSLLKDFHHRLRIPQVVVDTEPRNLHTNN
jgi:hypothetical protein